MKPNWSALLPLHMSTNSWRGHPWTAGQGRWQRRNVWEEHPSPGGEKAWLLQREASGSRPEGRGSPCGHSCKPSPFPVLGPGDSLCFPPRVPVPPTWTSVTSGLPSAWPRLKRLTSSSSSSMGLHRAAEPGGGAGVPSGAGSELRQGQDPAQTDTLDGLAHSSL